MPVEHARRVLMLGTFGLRPKATLRARALAMAGTLSSADWAFSLITTPWDNPGDAGRRWSEDGIPVRNTRGIHPIGFPRVMLETARVARAIEPDVVHLFKPKGFGDFSARWFRRNLPVVVDMDDWEGDGGWNEIGGYSRLQRCLFDWQERTWPRRAQALTVASRALEQRALELGADRDRVHYVPNGLTSERFALLSKHARKPKAAAGTPPVILLYTRFVEFQPEFVVRVLATVRNAIPGVTLLIAGASASGEPEIALRTAAHAAGLADAIECRGWVAQDEIPELAASCDLAIHPFDDNLINRAKCSVKLLELMSTGIPIVTSAVGENASYIEDSRSGRLSQPGDPQAMARAAVDLLRHRESADEIGRSAQKHVQQHYLWDLLAPRVAQAYVKALHTRANH